MYTHTIENVEEYLRGADEVFAYLKKTIDSGALERELRGQPSVSGFKRLT